MFFRKKITSGHRPFASILLAPILLVAVPAIALSFAVGEGGSRPPSTGLVEFDSGDFAGSGDCGWCHTGLTDSLGRDVSIDNHWRSTMMANAAKDPLWQAKVESEVLRNPSVQAVIEEKCATCHTPMARTQAVVDGEPVLLLGGGFFDPAHYLNPPAMDGISCTLCHQIQDIDLGQPESFSGNYRIDTTTTPPDRLIHGPFAQPFQNNMNMHTGFLPVEGVHVEDSGLCGTCHTLHTPTLDSSGNIVGEFPEQMTYPEWEHSAYATGMGLEQSCQDCHLPEADGEVVISNRPWWLDGRSPFGEHHLVGGNAFMIEMFKENILELGLTADTDHLDGTLVRTREQLESATANISLAHAEIRGGALRLVLKVNSQAGHKFPTGFPSRRAWIHLTVADRNGVTLFESGAPRGNGSIIHNAADDEPTAYEPHYDVIDSADQVQIYEAVMENTDGEITYTLLRAAEYAKDNRLLPEGFDKANAHDDIAVYGLAASDDSFNGGGDRITYLVPVQKIEKPFTVTARLLFQTVGYRFVEDLRGDTSSLIDFFEDLYDVADKAPEIVSSIEFTVPGPLQNRPPVPR